MTEIEPAHSHYAAINLHPFPKYVILMRHVPITGHPMK